MKAALTIDQVEEMIEAVEKDVLFVRITAGMGADELSMLAQEVWEEYQEDHCPKWKEVLNKIETLVKQWDELETRIMRNSEDDEERFGGCSLNSYMGG